VQATPAVQALHVPALQTRFVPQLVPSVTFVAASRQTEVPVEHEVVPLWQGFAGVQASPAVQALHVPALQTRFVPQVVPLATAIVESTQAPMGAIAIEHDVVPVWHGFVGTHATEVQLVQTPLAWQVAVGPPSEQSLPSAKIVIPSSTQTEVPVEQDVVPPWQGLVAAGAQTRPAVQAVHSPALHT